MNTKKPASSHYIQTALLFASMFTIIPIVDSFATHPTYAADPPPVCQNLTARQSDDKNYYNMSVTASAAKASDISGYQFDFGDHESYTFNFDTASSADRRQATVKHTYEKPGKYAVTARVISTKSGQATPTYSNSCTVSVTIAEAANVLPATGSSLWTTLIIAGVVGAITYAVTLEGVRRTSKF